MNSFSVFGKILIPVIMFSLFLLVILILIFLKLPFDQAQKLGSFLSGITSVGLIFISLGSIYATIYVAKSINELSTETRREDEYAERMIDVWYKMLATNTMLQKARDDERKDTFRDFDRERAIENLLAQQKAYVLVLKYYFSKHPKNFTGLANLLDLFTVEIENTTKLKQIGTAMFSILSK